MVNINKLDACIFVVGFILIGMVIGIFIGAKWMIASVGEVASKVHVDTVNIEFNQTAAIDYMLQKMVESGQLTHRP